MILLKNLSYLLIIHFSKKHKHDKEQTPRAPGPCRGGGRPGQRARTVSSSACPSVLRHRLGSGAAGRGGGGHTYKGVTTT